mmetsp:Transcript_23121/g.59421  ORF Transcript_23121/g.59421 Transcript_23121/m.59421 type:complete len:217 (+) Transcript_23121:622-1272(+)
MRSCTARTVLSSAHASRHQSEEEVRTGSSPSPASDRSQVPWLARSAAARSASASAAVTKSSIWMTHGSSASAVAFGLRLRETRRRTLLISPGLGVTGRASASRAHAGSECALHARQVHGHSFTIHGSAKQPFSRARTAQSAPVSWHVSDVHTPQDTRHCARMNSRLRSHSPQCAHRLHIGLRSRQPVAHSTTRGAPARGVHSPQEMRQRRRMYDGF